jgi:3-dehydroquinate synthase
MKQSEQLHLNGLPTLKDLKLQSKMDGVVFYDQKLLKNPFFKVWINKFPQRIALNAGESLKTLASYSVQLQKLTQFQVHKRTTFISVGGGSVGDFVGFLASTYKRGLRLVQVPSTWLAAIDSAHGGKNGLNFLNSKNQIGTFYLADQIVLSKKLLMSQPTDRVHDAFGEALKIGLINQPKLLQSIQVQPAFLWKNLKLMIAGKYKIVDQDPFEQTGLRQVLNLGHTMGHVFESAHRVSHGQAVLLGLMFAVRYSFHLGYLNKKEFIKICQILFSVPLKISYNKVLKIPDAKIKNLLLQDKKRSTGAEINFIFIHKIGNVFVQPVLISDLMAEVQRQRRQL